MLGIDVMTEVLKHAGRCVEAGQWSIDGLSVSLRTTPAMRVEVEILRSGWQGRPLRREVRSIDPETIKEDSIPLLLDFMYRELGT